MIHHENVIKDKASPQTQAVLTPKQLSEHPISQYNVFIFFLFLSLKKKKKTEKKSRKESRGAIYVHVTHNHTLLNI